MLGAVKKKKRKKGAIEFLHYRGMNVPRIEDRGLTNSKLDFHSPHLRDLKIPCNSILFFMYQYIIILSKKKKKGKIIRFKFLNTRYSYQFLQRLLD